MVVVVVRIEPYPARGMGPAKNRPTSELRTMNWLRREIGALLDQIALSS
jgi:hypothetical protein